MVVSSNDLKMDYLNHIVVLLFYSWHDRHDFGSI